MNKDYIILGLILLNVLSLVIVSIILAIKNKKKESERERYWQSQFLNYRENIYSIEKDNFQKLLNSEFQEIKGKIGAAAAQVKQLDGEIEQKKEFNSNLLKIRQDELDRLMAEKYAAAEAKIQSDIDEWAESAQEAAYNDSLRRIEEYRDIEQDYIDSICKLDKELNEFQEKRAALNEEILRQRRMEEEQDFFRVQLQDSTIRDVSILMSIRSELSKIDNFDKFIYDIYIKKSADEMVKRVLAGAAPSGIYKITRLKTGEVYVGKSTNVRDRWIQHLKSAYHCGTISHSILHTTMEKDGVQNFTFELLEEVPKDQLSTREKYWIKFYDSVSYGMNEKVG